MPRAAMSATSTTRPLFRIMLFAFLGLALLALGNPSSAGFQAPLPTARSWGTSKPLRTNPFGLVGAATMGLSTQLSAGSRLGVPYFRTVAAVVDDDVYFAQDTRQIRDAGLKVVLGIRSFAKNPFSQNGDPPAEQFPSRLDAYKQGVGKAIDQARPVLVTIGNESAIPDSFGGKAQQYQTMLAAACTIAHRHGIPCASDGMLAGSIARYTYYYLYYVEKDQAGAEAFREGGFAEYMLGEAPQQIKTRVEQNLLPWIQAYKNANPDFVNFHWYSRPGVDPKGNADAFATVARVLQRATGRPAITNEHGLRDDDAAVLTCRMRTVIELRMPYAIFYNSDAGEAHPRALMESDGTMRVTGLAFGDFSRALNAGRALPSC
jgi:hypothetical protein